MSAQDLQQIIVSGISNGAIYGLIALGYAVGFSATRVINFALGVRSFDVAHHQPHPPGYPIFIAMGKGVHRLIPSEPKALSVLSVSCDP